jgi:hypothetical protein
MTDKPDRYSPKMKNLGSPPGWTSLGVFDNWVGQGWSAGRFVQPGVPIPKELESIGTSGPMDEAARNHDLAINDAYKGFDEDIAKGIKDPIEARRDLAYALAKADEDFLNDPRSRKTTGPITALAQLGLPVIRKNMNKQKAAYEKHTSDYYNGYLNDTVKVDWDQYEDGEDLSPRSKSKPQYISPENLQLPSDLPTRQTAKAKAPDTVSNIDFGFDNDIATAPANPKTGAMDNSGTGTFGEDYGDDMDRDGGADISGNSADWSGGSDVGMGDLGSDTEGAGGWGFPVVLDLNGDGYFDVLPPSKSKARFDIMGTGKTQVLAWVGPEDGLLVYDRDGDRLISHRDEFAFKDYLANAETDLEGLAWFDQVVRGGNGDGVLDDQDEAWAKFGIWRDVDQDGQTDPGELRMTGEGGLSSVNLASDHQPRDAGPDAQVFGQGEFQVTDDQGNTQSGNLYDTALRYEEAVSSDEEAPVKKSIAEILYPNLPRAWPEEPQVVENDGDQGKGFVLHNHPTSGPQEKEPMLVRRDGQPLTHGEMLYPGMVYDEAVYLPWPGRKY